MRGNVSVSAEWFLENKPFKIEQILCREKVRTRTRADVGGMVNSQFTGNCSSFNNSSPEHELASVA